MIAANPRLGVRADPDPVSEQLKTGRSELHPAGVTSGPDPAHSYLQKFSVVNGK